ncbi:MAG: helix-turn-helix domain-containing protein [Pseudonocardiaceae bacterium]
MVGRRHRLVSTRKAAGFSQERLAETVGVERSTVMRWERGETRPQPWARPKLARALGISDQSLSELLGESTDFDSEPETRHGIITSRSNTKHSWTPPLERAPEEVGTRFTQHEARSREAGLVGAYAEATALSATIGPYVIEDTGWPMVPTVPEVMAGIDLSAGVELAEGFATPLDYLTFLSSAARCVSGEQRDRIYDQLTQLLRRWAGVMNRRELFQLFGWGATTIATSAAVSGLDDEEQDRLAHAIIDPSRVDIPIIEHLATILRHCKQKDDVLGPRAVLHTVLTQRQLARHLLTECPGPLRPRLLAVYSGMSSSVGDYCFDLNNPVSAGYYYNDARTAAHEARNTEFGIYALCSMSYVASAQGKAHIGIDLAAAARNLAAQTNDQLLRVCVAERAGTAYAVDGQYKSFAAEFDKAQDYLVSTEDALPESPAYYYHEGLLASHRSECLLLLEKPNEAAVSARVGLTVFNKSYVDGYALCTLHLGNSYLQVGEVEEAAQVIGSAATLAARNRQARLVKELHVARARMQLWQDTQAVKALDERLAAEGLGVAGHGWGETAAVAVGLAEMSVMSSRSAASLDRERCPLTTWRRSVLQ